MSTRIQMTKAEAQAWKDRWRRVNAFEIEELRHSTPEQNLRQLAILMTWPSALGVTEALRAEKEEARRRWRQVQAALEKHARANRAAG